MEPNEDERADLAQRVRAERIRRHGTRIAAYVAAGVNAATWSKLEEGTPVYERSLIAVIKHLWPETGGDWTRMVPPLGTSHALRDAVMSAGDLSDEARTAILAILEQENQQLDPPTSSREQGAS